MKFNGSLLIILSGFLILTFTYLFSIFFDIPFGDLSRDPSAIYGADPFIGMLSNFGVIFWSISAGICFFTYFLINKQKNSYDKILIAYSGFISLILLLDDLLMFHDKIIPYFLGLSEVYLFLLYGILIIFYCIFFLKTHLKTNYMVLVISLGLFGTSLIIDLFPFQIDSNSRIIYEDGVKFLGISFWTCYQFIICRQTIFKIIKV